MNMTDIKSKEQLIHLLRERSRLHDEFRLAEQRGNCSAELNAFDRAHSECIDWLTDNIEQLQAMLTHEPCAADGLTLMARGDDLSLRAARYARNKSDPQPAPKATPCPVHGDDPCLRWYANDGVHGHPTEHDLREALTVLTKKTAQVDERVTVVDDCYGIECSI